MEAGSMGGVTGGENDKEEEKCWNGREPLVAELSQTGELSAEV